MSVGLVLYCLPDCCTVLVGFSGDGGLATSAQLNRPRGVAVDYSGNLFIADQLNHRIRKVNTSGNIRTVAGDGTPGFSGDGGPATSAQLDSPAGVTVDAFGNLFISDRLAKFLKAAKMTGGWGLKECPIVGIHQVE